MSCRDRCCSSHLEMTFTACNFIYLFIKHAGAKRILFLVDRSNLGRQALAEFQKFRTPEENRLFTDLYNVQPMQSNKLGDVSKVCITTIQARRTYLV